MKKLVLLSGLFSTLFIGSAFAAFLVVTGGPTTIVSSSGAAQWLTDIAASGVLYSQNFATSGAVSAATYPGDQNNDRLDHVTWETTATYGARPPSGGGWARDAILDSDGTSNGAVRFYIAPDHRVFGPAQSSKEYYIRWSEVNPSAGLFIPFPGTGGNSPYADGTKHIILSSFAAANPSPGANAYVIEDMQYMGCPRAYYWDGASIQATEVPVPGNPSYNKYQSGLDNGGATGTLAQLKARYGPLYPSTPVNTGTPESNGGFADIADEVTTYEVRVKFGATFDDTTIEGWAAHAGQAPVRWLYNTGITLGNNIGGHDGFWLTSYTSYRTSNNGIDTWRLWSDVISSTQPIRINGNTITPTP